MLDLGKIKKILVLAPHTDDGEFGCGGSIAKFINQGKEVYYVAFSAAEQSVLPQFPKDILITEVKAATKTLGIKPQNLFLFRYDVRTFNFHRQEILDNIIELKKSINPDLVIMPSRSDIHQDHSTIADEAVRAFKYTSILAYELVWNSFNFNTSCFIILNEEDMNKKVKALSCYKSQAHKPYASEEFLRSLANVRGVQINAKLAEAFEVIRWVIK